MLETLRLNVERVPGLLGGQSCLSFSDPFMESEMWPCLCYGTCDFLFLMVTQLC